MRLRPLLKPVLNRFLPPLTKWYLRKPRRFRHLGLDLVVQPGVFHPGLYISSKYLAEQVMPMDLHGKQVLELGAGSGFLSLLCASRGAAVTATDISPIAIENIQQNAARNHLELEVVESDLFAALPVRAYDLVLVNPPYFPGEARSAPDHAWYCGPDWEYFQNLFDGLGAYLHAESRVLMVLSEDVALAEVRRIAGAKGWTMEEADRSKRLGEWNYIFQFGR